MYSTTLEIASDLPEACGKKLRNPIRMPQGLAGSAVIGGMGRDILVSSLKTGRTPTSSDVNNSIIMINYCLTML